MAFRFVIFLKVNTRQDPFTVEGNKPFLWEVRELLTDTSGTPLPERAGPTLGFGGADTMAQARFDAESFAELLSSEDIYLYDTRVSDPTPPSP